MGKRKKNPHELKFNTKIYKKRAIKKAISDYAHLTKFSLINSPGYIKIRVDKISSGVKNKLLDEFSNYVLGMTKKCL
jgi:hypothetical protein